MRPKFIARQFSNPRGLLGYLVGCLMNRGNAGLNAFAVQQLDLQSLDRVLDIGFGGGVALPALIAAAAYVAGIDRSPDAVKIANSRFSKAVEEDRAEFREGSVESLPYDSGRFARVLTVHTIYFWKCLDRSFKEIHRVLSPGGRVVVGFLPKQHMDRMRLPADIFTPRTSEEVARALLEAGFRQVRTQLPDVSRTWNVIVAER